MDLVRNSMENIINKCDICINGNIISRELLIKTFYEFIATTINKKSHNVGIILKTESLCFDAILLIYAGLSNILFNHTYSENLTSTLIPGDMVLYYKKAKNSEKPQRYIFNGFVEKPGDPPKINKKNYIVLEQIKGKEKEITYVGEKSWAQIVPYWGESTLTDGRGLRKENGKRAKFFETVLEIKESEIPRIIDTSTVFVMTRDRANTLINGLSLKFDGIEIKLTELIPVSYYADLNSEYPYSGNAARAEAVIKITGKISVARKLVLQRNGNHNIGLVILGDEIYHSGQSEIPELINRQSIQYVYLCVHIDSEISEQLLKEYENADLFACTKEFLLSNSQEPVILNPLTKQLKKQAYTIINRKVTPVEIQNFIEWEEYKTFKKTLSYLKHADYDSNEKDDLIVQSYSLMNLFLTMVFSIKQLDEYIEMGKIDNVEMTTQRLDRIEKDIQKFPDYLKKSAEYVFNVLGDAYLKLYDNTNKKDSLYSLIRENPNLKIAVVVPKAYYLVPIKDYLEKEFPSQKSLITVINVNRYDNSNLYDLIIAVGNITGTYFDVTRCRCAREIKILLYGVEKYQYNSKSNKAKKTEHLLNRRSTIITGDKFEDEWDDSLAEETDEIEKIDNDIRNFAGTAAERSFHNSAIYSESKKRADIIAIAKFNTGEMAFFSKNYKAYVLDESENTVKEIEAKNLEEGDTIIFTRSNSKTRDIVESLLQDMITKKLVSSEIENAYYKAGEWKTSLIEYMKQTGISEEEVADEMIRNGVGVQEATIKGWLDEGSHIIRPKKIESIQQIGLITGNEELFDHAEECYEAGSIIYNIRRQILKTVGQAILGEVTGQNSSSDAIMVEVSERVKDAAVILEIETIKFTNDTVPIYAINRPMSVD